MQCTTRYTICNQCSYFYIITNSIFAWILILHTKWMNTNRFYKKRFTTQRQWKCDDAHHGEKHNLFVIHLFLSLCFSIGLCVCVCSGTSACHSITLCLYSNKLFFYGLLAHSLFLFLFVVQSTFINWNTEQTSIILCRLFQDNMEFSGECYAALQSLWKINWNWCCSIQTVMLVLNLRLNRGAAQCGRNTTIPVQSVKKPRENLSIT